MPEKLKQGWTRVAFGDVVQLCRERSGAPLDDGFDRYVGLEHLEPGDLKIRRWGNIADGTTFTNVFRTGQVLFGKRRAYQRKVALADFEGVCSGDIYVFKTKNETLLSELLPFICQSDGFFNHAIGTSAGSLSPRTNWESLASYEFALPPPEEQRLIAEVLLAHLETRKGFQNAVRCAERLRMSLLRWHFSDCGSECLVALRSLVDNGDVELKTGPFGTVLAAKEYQTSGCPIVNPTDMKSGRICHEGGPCVDDATANRLDVYRLREGDILLARKADLSKAVLAATEHTGWIGGSDTIRLRCTSSKVLPGYLHLALQTDGAARMLYSYAHGTVMPGLNEKALYRISINLPDGPEQQAVVDHFRLIEARERELLEREVACAVLGRVASEQLLTPERSLM